MLRTTMWVSVLHFLAEVAIVLPAYLLYFLVRGLTEGNELTAIRRADDLIGLERALGIFWEPDLQEHLLRWDIVTNLANWTYIWGHWPVILAVALWLFFFRRMHYPVYRNAFIISGAIGLVIFATLPVAPPRFMEAWGFVDTVTERSEAYRVLQPPAFVNQYAAMPSLHFGWNLLISIALVRHGSALALKALGYVMPVASFLAIVLTANHYILDGVFGGVVALTGLAVALWLSRRFSGWRLAGG